MERVNWNTVASCVENIYGGIVDWDKKYFVCPDCGEPIYADDFPDFEVIPAVQTKINQEDNEYYICPICGVPL